MKIREYPGGLKIYPVATSNGNHEATVAFNKKSKSFRFVFDGEISIDRTKGSWKFGDQIQFVLWTTNPVKIEKRAFLSNKNNYNRIEIAVPLSVGKKMLQDALRNIAEIEKSDFNNDNKTIDTIFK